MTSVVRASVGAFLVGTFAGVAAPAPARADDAAITQCIAASDKGLDLRRQGKLTEARHVLADCATTACGDAISRVCATRVADIQAAMPSIVFSPKDSAGMDLVGVRVRIDGAAKAEPLDGRPIAADPGPHTFVFEASGQPTVSREFILVEGVKGRQERIDIGAPAVATPTSRSGAGQRVAGWAVAGVGVAGVAAGGAFGPVASSKYSEQTKDCSSPTPANCTNHQGAVSAHSAAITDATISTVAFAVGAAAVATGLVVVLTAPRSATHEGVAMLRIAPAIAPSFAGLSLQGVVP